MSKPLAPAVQFKQDLVTRKEQFSDVLPPNVTFEKFQAAAMTMVHTSPDVMTCPRASVLTSLMKCAADGLVPDGREAALVVFGGQKGKTVTYMPMVAGLIKRVRNSGEVVSIWSEMVYENEDLVVWVEDGGRKWDHRFDPMNRTGGIKGAYAVAKLADGTVEFEAMGKAEIEQVRAVSRAKDAGPWKTWWSEMAKKTVIRRLCKRLPIKSEDQRVIQESDRETIRMRDVTPGKTMQERLEERRQPSPPVEPDAAPEPPEEAGEAIEGETIDVSSAFPGSEEWTEGQAGFGLGETLEQCPYDGGQRKIDWIGGWLQAKEQAE